MTKAAFRLLILVCCLALLAPAVAAGEEAGQGAPEGHENQDFTYSVCADGSAVIDSYVGSSPDVIIPDTLDGYTVTGIGEQAFLEKEIVSVVIPASVTSIGDFAFLYCYSLQNVTLPEGLAAIAPGTFCYCSSLTRIDLPAGITSIGERAFMNCSCLSEIILPEGLTSIGNGAFCGCSILSAITLPDSVTDIEGDAFSFTGLTDIAIPAGVSSMAGNPFSACTGLEAIEMSPDNACFEILDGVLFDKSGSRLVGYPCGLGALEYIVPEGVGVIGNSAFMYCNNLLSVTVPASVTTIEASAFMYCDNLSRVVIPESVTTIENDAFSMCAQLTLEVTAGSYAEQYCAEHNLQYTLQ